MNNPKVSVIIPIFNVQKYIKECLDSLLNQTLKEIEVICVDDGSTDNSGLVVKEYAAKDGRFILFTQTNQGVSVARNVGINVARGQYIYFLDGDDYIEPDALETACRELDNKRLDIVYFDTYAFGEDGISEKDVDDKNKYYARSLVYSAIFSGEELLYTLLKNSDYSCPVWKQVIRRDFLQEHQIRFYNGIIHEDELYTIQTMMLAGRVAYIERVLHHRRLRPESIMTRPLDFQSVYGYFICVKEAFPFLLERGCNAQKLNQLLVFLRSIFFYARTQYLKLEESERRKYEKLPEEEKFLFQLGIVDYASSITERNKTLRGKEALVKKLNEARQKVAGMEKKHAKTVEKLEKTQFSTKSLSNELKNVKSGVFFKTGRKITWINTHDKRFKLASKKMQFLKEMFSDSKEFVSGWFHDFVCPKCASQMKFDIVEGGGSPEKEFFCSNCQAKVTGQKYFEAWVYRYRRYFAENLDSVVVCINAGNDQALDFLKTYVNFYADCYYEFPVHGQHVGKGKIMAQSLDEAVWGIYVLKAIHDCRSFFTAEQLENWYDKLFAPMANLLIPQIKSFNNISVWIQSCIGMIGLIFDKKDIVETALHSEFGLYKQLEKGLTEDYLWYEGSLHYHYYMLEGLTFFCELYANYEPQSKLLLMLDKMYQAPSEFIYDDCRLFSLNDGWYPLTLKDYAKQIVKAAAICKSKALLDQVAVIGAKFPEVFDDPGMLLYEKDIDSKARFLFNGRMAVIQKPFPVILKSGSCTASHMHRDCLSLLIPPLSVDLGTPGYGSQLNDSWYRSSLSHNTISIDGEQPEKLLDTVVYKTKDGMEATVKNWPGVVRISRRLTPKGNSIKELTTVKTDGKPTFDWTFHSDGTAKYNLTGFPVDSLGKGYELFSDIQRISFEKDFCAIFEDNTGLFLKVKIPYMKGVELYTAKTPGNPADHKRNTLLLRTKGAEAKFEIIYVSTTREKLKEGKRAELQRKSEKTERELNNLKSGWSFRIGRVITYLPRKLKYWLLYWRSPK